MVKILYIFVNLIFLKIYSMKTSINSVIEILGLNLGFWEKVFYDTFKTDTALISSEGKEILNNDEDREIIEKAVENMKKKKSNFSVEVELSNNRKIKISIG